MSMGPIDVIDMTQDDVEEAAGLLSLPYSQALLTYYVGSLQSFPLVAKEGSEIVGVIVGNKHGNVGWIGHERVKEGADRDGIFARLINKCITELATEKLVIGVEDQEFRSFLESSPYNFEYTTGETYVCLRSTTPPQSSVEAQQANANHRPRILELDEAATGEDRSHLFPQSLTSGWVVVDQGELKGFWIPWGYEPPIAAPNAGPIITAQENDVQTALALLAKQPQGSGTFYNAVVLEGNAGLSALEGKQFSRHKVVPRLHRGSIDWHANQIFGVHSLALG
jgi:hypothetical protein